MFPFSKQDSEDPTTQLAWPTRQHTASSAPHDDAAPPSSQSPAKLHRRSSSLSERALAFFTTWDFFTLSVSMAGAQIAWTVELGYGTPFLLSLGVSEQVTSLVWLAGPISGLVAQPLIGAISDSSTSRYRRRYWVCLSTAALVASTLVLAWCQTFAAFFVDIYGGGAGDWDPERDKLVTNVSIGLAVFSFYILDFALNALQASLRNLLLDITPSEQLNTGNAWHSRMIQAGSIVGYAFGFFPLAKLPFLKFLGGDQFRKFCVVCISILVITVWTTCWCHDEKGHIRRRSETRSKFSDVLETISTAIFTLPVAIRKVCIVQLCAFTGWFPYLFYATTYVGQIMAYQLDREPDIEYATRQGELAMLLHSIVAVLAGVALPRLARRDRRLVPKDDETDDVYKGRLRIMYKQWVEATDKGKPIKLPRMPLLLRDIWMGAMLLFSILTFSTFWIRTVPQATVMISLIGICWGVACWVPFTIVMELVQGMGEQPPRVRPPSPSQRCTSERAPLLGSHTDEEVGESTHSVSDEPKRPLAGGTVLGIHNLAIVMPQFFIAIIASVIFRIVDGSESVGASPPVPTPDLGTTLLDVGSVLANQGTYYGKNGVAWVLRFGGLCTLMGAILARGVPLTNGEHQMAYAIEQLKTIQAEEEP